MKRVNFEFDDGEKDDDDENEEEEDYKDRMGL